MMVDAPRHELAKAHARGDDEENRDDPAETPGQKASAQAGPHQEQPLQRHGKDDAGEALGGLLIGEEAKEADQPGDGQVHQPRPMHERAGRRVQPQGTQIVPALSRQPVPDLHHAHGVVSVAVDAGAPDLRDAWPG